VITIKVGGTLVIPGQGPSPISYIDISMGPCIICEHPQSTIRLLVPLGIVTMCANCHNNTYMAKRAIDGLALDKGISLERN
jgi:hypothetical protein